MGWDGSGNFTRTNGDNTGSTTWQRDKADGDRISASRHDSHDQDLADGIAACLAKNGENAMTADLDMGGNDIINYGSGNVTLPQISFSTYTPTLTTSNADGSFTYFEQLGSYMAIGDFVTLHINISASFSAGTGTFRIVLPHTLSATYNGTASIGSYTGIDSDKGLYGYPTKGTNYMTLENADSGDDDSSAVVMTDLDSSLILLRITAHYIKA